MYEVVALKTKGKVISELQLPEASVRDIIAGIPASVLVIDGDSCSVRICNNEFEKRFGYATEDLHQSSFNFLQLLEPFQHGRFRMQLQTVRNDPSQRGRYIIYRVKTKQGDYLQSYLYAAPLPEGEGRIKNGFTITILSNFSEWDLPFISSDTRELFLEQFDNDHYGTFEWLPTQNQQFWSEGMYRIYDVDKSFTEIDLDFFTAFIPQEERTCFLDALLTAVHTGGNADITYKIAAAGKKQKTLHLQGRMFATTEGNPAKFVGSVTDVTSQLATEEGLKNNVDELNRSNRELEEFAYIASHDLQEPLRKISTFGDRLNERYKEALEGDGAMYLERMIASAGNMRLLIDNLLEFSRVAKSTQPFTPTNLNFILHQVKTDLELVTEETGTIINSATLPTINASMTQMKQLFLNIISNAIKFHRPEEKPIINIGVEELSEREKIKNNLSLPTKYYRIQIADNGIGFEQEYANKIFQIFQRLHGKSEYPGSGIGLAICKKIAERHHGLIFAESTPGQGATFTFILPEHEPVH